jgi:hypothetical protein
MITLSMRLQWLKRWKTLHCYHLVTFKTAAVVAAFSGKRSRSSQKEKFRPLLWTGADVVLDLFL